MSVLSMIEERICGVEKQPENPFEIESEDEERSQADLAEDSNNYPSGFEPDEEKSYE